MKSNRTGNHPIKYDNSVFGAEFIYCVRKDDGQQHSCSDTCMGKAVNKLVYWLVAVIRPTKD